MFLAKRARFRFNTAVRTSYRYLILEVNTLSGGGVNTAIREIEYSADAGSTWLPSSNMTSNTAPSPLVASAIAEFDSSTRAWEAFNGDAGSTSFWRSTSNADQWITIDLGSGNEIAPNRIRITNMRSLINSSLGSFKVYGSNTGNTPADGDLLVTVTGLSSQANGTVTTYTI